MGNGTLQGGVRNDVYKFSIGDGLDNITDVDSTVCASLVAILALIYNAAFWKSRGHLTICYSMSTTDKVKVQSQDTSSNTVERFELSNDFYMTDVKVNQVLTTMTSYASIKVLLSPGWMM